MKLSVSPHFSNVPAESAKDPCWALMAEGVRCYAVAQVRSIRLSRLPAWSAFFSANDLKRTSDGLAASRSHRQMEIQRASAFSPRPILMDRKRYSRGPDLPVEAHRTTQVSVDQESKSTQAEESCLLPRSVSRSHGTGFSSGTASQSKEPSRRFRHSTLRRRLFETGLLDDAHALQKDSLACRPLPRLGYRVPTGSPRNRPAHKLCPAPIQYRGNFAMRGANAL